jgi:hypothetical protein
VAALSFEVDRILDSQSLRGPQRVTCNCYVAVQASLLVSFGILGGPKIQVLKPSARTAHIL